MYALSGMNLSLTTLFKDISRLPIGKQFARIDRTHQIPESEDERYLHFDLLMLEKKVFFFHTVREYTLIPLEEREDADKRLLFYWQTKLGIKKIEGNIHILSKPSRFNRDVESEAVVIMPVNSEMIIQLKRSNEQVYLPNVGWLHPEYFVFRWNGESLSAEHQNREWYYGLARDKKSHAVYL